MPPTRFLCSQGKTGLGDVTTYICENFTCQAPLVGIEALRKKCKVEMGGTP